MRSFYLRYGEKRARRAWMRILEAVIAIMIIAGVLLVMSSTSSESEDSSEYIYKIEKRILKQISQDEELRENVLNNENQEIVDFVELEIPSGFEFEVKICDLDIDEPCRMSEYVEDDVFVEETIIASNLRKYNPKKVRLFVWERT
jgi:hypothetical protein